MKLQGKVFLALTPLIVTPLVALGFLLYAQMRDALESETLEQIITETDQIKRHIQSRTEVALSNLVRLSESPSLEPFLVSTDGNRDDLRANVVHALTEYLVAYPVYYEVKVLLPNGREAVRVTNPNFASGEFENNNISYVQEIVDAAPMTYTTIVQNSMDGEFSLVTSQRLEVSRSFDDSESPQPMGYLVAATGIDSLRDRITTGRINGLGALYMVDGQGRIIVQSERTDGTLPAAVAGSSMRMHEIGLDETSTLIHAEPIGGSLQLIATVSNIELVGAQHRLGMIVGSVTVAVTVVASLLFFLILRTQLLDPITKLGRAARDIARGNLDVGIKLKREDELGDLAHSFQEVSQNLRFSAEQINYFAYHDSLTGLPNRRMFTELLGELVNDRSSAGSNFALLFLDLDDFKRINDTLGHQAGDKLLQAFTHKITQCVKAQVSGDESDLDKERTLISRFAGDEFMIVLPGHGADDAEVMAERIIDSIAQGFIIDGQRLRTGTSIGITQYPQDGSDVDQLIRNADLALYSAKNQGRGVFRRYKSDMQTAFAKRPSLEDDLEAALDNDQLILEYLPQIELATERVISIEALVRWQHPQYGLLAPDNFIPIAERTGLIVPLGAWVLEHACMQARVWQTTGLENFTVSVNISAHQLRRSEFEREVLGTLTATGIEASSIEVDISENNLVHGTEDIIQSLRGLRAIGVRVAIDDFGCGYSSLSMLDELPVNSLKIDRLFTRNLINKQGGYEIMSAIVAMARQLGLQVIAEGVEDHRQLALLKKMRCDMIQGYLVSKPITADQVPVFLDSRLVEACSA